MNKVMYSWENEQINTFIILLFIFFIFFTSGRYIFKLDKKGGGKYARIVGIILLTFAFFLVPFLILVITNYFSGPSVGIPFPI